MFIRQQYVADAVENLSRVHPFFGITFLVCKLARLPVGSTTSLPINTEEQNFLDRYYHPNLDSKYYFQPFRVAGNNRWLSHKYPMSGSQSTRTRGQLAKALLHETDTDIWGWAADYVRVLREKLERDKSGKVPAFWLAVWLFRHRKFGRHTTAKTLVETFLREFLISPDEQLVLFDLYPPLLDETLLVDEPFSDTLLLRGFDSAPDASPDEGGTLIELNLREIGPAASIEFAPGERLSIITGDNGLGKTFLLECAWWSLTGDWSGRPALPLSDAKRPTIQFSVAGRAGVARRQSVTFDLEKLRWPEVEERPTIAGLVVYAKIDGSFAVWDPSRIEHGSFRGLDPGRMVFSRDEVLDGLPPKIEGLIRDWVRWQSSRDQTTFEMFQRVLGRLSPPDSEPLVPGEPTRLPGDVRDIPTLRHDYGTVPITNESAGVRRIVTLAYLLVWAWTEHKIQSSILNRQAQKNIVVMIDEIESHLHPKWQRAILPAIIEVAEHLDLDVKAQVIVATHSPLVLASIETLFNPQIDKLFHLYLGVDKRVALDELPYAKRGTADEWLTSEVFQLKEPRSREGEGGLEEARRALESSLSDPRAIGKITERLSASLPSDDVFWPRWLHFARAKGAI